MRTSTKAKICAMVGVVFVLAPMGQTHPLFIAMAVVGVILLATAVVLQY